MKYLGIDYGTKRIGIALSDDRATIAFAHSIIENNNHSTITEILSLMDREGVETIVIGESVHLDGTANQLMKRIECFKSKLEEKTKVPIFLEKEWMSSVAARSHMYTKGNIANEQWSGKANAKKRGLIDDRAAAVILQRFLDKK